MKNPYQSGPGWAWYDETGEAYPFYEDFIDAFRALSSYCHFYLDGEWSQLLEDW